MTGNREMPLGMHPDTLVQWYLIEVMSYNTEEWVWEQIKDLVIQRVSTLMQSHLIQKSYFTICINLTFGDLHFDHDLGVKGQI